MAIEVKLPELGENITAATVLDVLVAEGDTVEKDQPILSLESEKAEFDLPSPAAGKITKLLVKKGDEIEVGQVIILLEDSGRASGAGSRDGATSEGREREAKPAKPTREAEPPGRAPAPKPQESHEQEEAPRREEPDAREERPRSTRPSRDERAPQPKPRPSRDERAPQSEARSPRDETADEPTSRARLGASPPSEERRAAVAAPAVRKLARELGIDISEVSASAADGRVLAEDVYRHVRRKLGNLEGDGARAKSDGAHDYSRWGATRVEPMTTVRRRTAEQMSLAWSSIPHVTHHDTADITELDRLRRQFAPRVERAGGKLTITAVLLKVLGSALRRYPKFNASVDMDHDEIVYKDFVNVGVAVDTERGLLVPVIRAVDEKNIVELAVALHEVSEAARTRKLRPDLLQGATFTVTNLGGIGGTHFSPLINPPEVAVLGVSRAGMKPVWVKNEFEPRLMLPLSVTYDHRIIDGADAARFIRWVCEALEEPFLMDLEGQ